MLGSAIFKNPFGRTYRLHTLGGGPLPKSCKPNFFPNIESAERFLSSLNLSSEFCRRLAHSLGLHPGGQRADLLLALSGAIIKRRFSIIEVHVLNPTDNPPSKRTLGKKGAVSYRFEPSASVIERKPKEVKAFTGMPAALSFINELGASDEELEALVESLPLSKTPLGAVEPNIRTSLAKRIIEEEITVCVERPMSRVTTGGTPIGEPQVIGTAPRSVPLAPPTLKTWIEVALLDDDDNPVADEAYLIVDTDGNEYQGVTNAKGEIRVTGIEIGACKVSFPDIDQSGIA